MENGYIYLNNNIFPTLLAISAEEQQRGLMGRQWPPPIMSFIYSEPQINKFWMNGTISPLDIIFCHNNRVSEICYGEPYSTRIIGSNLFSDLVIELPYGTAETSKIKVGHEAGLVKPTPKELHKIFAKKLNNFIKL